MPARQRRIGWYGGWRMRWTWRNSIGGSITGIRGRRVTRRKRIGCRGLHWAGYSLNVGNSHATGIRRGHLYDNAIIDEESGKVHRIVTGIIDGDGIFDTLAVSKAGYDERTGAKRAYSYI